MRKLCQLFALIPPPYPLGGNYQQLPGGRAGRAGRGDIGSRPLNVSVCSCTLTTLLPCCCSGCYNLLLLPLWFLACRFGLAANGLKLSSWLPFCILRRLCFCATCALPSPSPGHSLSLSLCLFHFITCCFCAAFSLQSPAGSIVVYRLFLRFAWGIFLGIIAAQKKCN